MVKGINNGFPGTNAINNGTNGTQRTTDKAAKTEGVSRAEEIKKEIEAGTYKLDMRKTAEKVAESLL